ncbi:MAG: hypothetical protein AAFV53_22405 [Myxococcota bacterium]
MSRLIHARSLSVALAGLLLPLAAAAQAAPCATRSSVTELRLTLEEAEAQYAALDLDAFQERMTAADQTIRCLGEPLTRAASARYHRLMGLRAAAEQLDNDADAAFAAARALEPAAPLPTRLVPTGHPLQLRYANATPSPEVTVLPDPADGYLLLDGIADTARPVNQPTLFQHIDDNGSVLRSVPLAPSTPTPTYTLAPDRRQRSGVFLGASLAGAGLVLGTTGFLVNRAARNTYDAGDQTSSEQLDQDRRLVNRSGAAAIAGAGLSVVGGSILFTWAL